MEDYLPNQVFAAAKSSILDPDPAGIAGFQSYLRRYKAALAAEKIAYNGNKQMWKPGPGEYQDPVNVTKQAQTNVRVSDYRKSSAFAELLQQLAPAQASKVL